MNRDLVTIVRTGLPKLERAVAVVKFDRIVGYVNPVYQIFLATACSFNRTGCIVGFADGISSAGFDVWIDDQRKGREKGLCPHSNYYSTIPVYWLFGRLWSLRQWGTFSQTMDRLHIPLGEARVKIIEETARFYLDRPWNLSTRLIVPPIF